MRRWVTFTKICNADRIFRSLTSSSSLVHYARHNDVPGVAFITRFNASLEYSLFCYRVANYYYNVKELTVRRKSRMTRAGRIKRTEIRDIRSIRHFRVLFLKFVQGERMDGKHE
jgi:hypothetical protein